MKQIPGGGAGSWRRMLAHDVGLLNWLDSHLILKMLSLDATEILKP